MAVPGPIKAVATPPALTVARHGKLLDHVPPGIGLANVTTVPTHTGAGVAIGTGPVSTLIWRVT